MVAHCIGDIDGGDRDNPTRTRGAQAPGQPPKTTYAPHDPPPRDDSAQIEDGAQIQSAGSLNIASYGS